VILGMIIFLPSLLFFEEIVISKIIRRANANIEATILKVLLFF
jgi:hypothetical protein